MKYWIFFTLSIVLGISSLPCRGADILDVSQYALRFNQQRTGTTSKIVALSRLAEAHSLPCEKKQETATTYLLSPVCLLQEDVSGLLSFSGAIHAIWPQISSFSGVYDEQHINFDYDGALPLWKNSIPRVFSLGNLQVADKLYLLQLQKSGILLRFSINDLALMMAQQFSFYAVQKDLTPLLRCTKQNYSVALSAFDDFLFRSGAVVNVNDEISYLRGYCKGSGPKNLMFYGGVCGFATQLFRLSLLIPGIDIVKRENHSFWLVPYYSEYVFGDDAALYQKKKQLELRNSVGMDMMVKVLDKGTANYLVAILPRQQDRYVSLTKQQIGPLQGQVVREFYTKAQRTFVDSQLFDSWYAYKEYSVR